MKTHLALLRGINVGGNKKVSMADLRAFVKTIGFKEPRTLLQSGNLVFKSDGKHDDTALETLLETEAFHRLGLKTVFLIRTPEEWTEVIARNPFADEAKSDPSHLIVMFLRQPPTPEAIQSLHAVMSGGEQIHLDGRHLYAIFPNGIGESKLAAVLMGTKFSQHATGRNWNSVTKLGALAGR